MKPSLSFLKNVNLGTKISYLKTLCKTNEFHNQNWYLSGTQNFTSKNNEIKSRVFNAVSTNPISYLDQNLQGLKHS